MKCACCHNEFDEFKTNHKCDYCGFLNMDSLIHEQSTNLSNYRATEYRENILYCFYDLSITASSYRFNTDKESFDQEKNVELFDKKKTGSYYFGKIVWSEDWIANPSALDFVGKKQTIPFSYTFSGITHNGEFVIESKDAEGVECHLGLMIDDNLNLNLFLGNENTILAKDKVNIEWL